MSDSRKVVQVTTDDHGFSLGYDADNGLYTLVDLTRFYLVSKADLSPTAESLTKPTSKGYTFSQWVAVAEKSGNTVTLTFNINGSMDASSDFVLLTTLPEKYRPKMSHYHSYCTQEERSMVMIIYTDGKIMLFNNNRLASGLFLRQTISYPVA